MADSRIFCLDNGLTAMDVAGAVRGFFEFEKELHAEVIETPQGIIIQAKQMEGWKRLVGMDNSIQVQIIDQQTTMIVNIGSGKWIDKAGAAALGIYVFAPLAVTALIGAIAIRRLPEEIFSFIDRFIIKQLAAATKDWREETGVRRQESEHYGSTHPVVC